MGNGICRALLDDARGNQRELPIGWSHDRFCTFSPVCNNKQTEGMELGGDQYERIGVRLVARLLTLNQKADRVASRVR